MPSSTPAFNLSEQLAKLVPSLFSADELRHLFGFWPAGRPIGTDVALDGAAADIAERAVQELVGQGLGDAFFLLLQEKRPLRRDEIDALQRRWQFHRPADDGARAPLPLSAEMERIQLFAESDDLVVHKETTSLHLLHAMLAVPLGYDAQTRLGRLVQPDRLLRALKSLARAEDAGLPAGTKITRPGYARLWALANDLAHRRGGHALQYPDMLMAICTLRPAVVTDYLQMIDVGWDAFANAGKVAVIARNTRPADPSAAVSDRV
jgi:hypothetical protein